MLKYYWQEARQEFTKMHYERPVADAYELHLEQNLLSNSPDGEKEDGGNDFWG